MMDCEDGLQGLPDAGLPVDQCAIAIKSQHFKTVELQHRYPPKGGGGPAAKLGIVPQPAARYPIHAAFTALDGDTSGGVDGSLQVKHDEGCWRWRSHRREKGQARELGETLKMLFQMAMELWRSTTKDQHLLKVLRGYHRQGALLRFLEEPLVEPTNNWVERALRPAVIARKVSQCSKNDAGAYAFSAFKSVIQTLVKRGAGSPVEPLYALFCFPKASLVPG
jgi:hypothetical protein